ncbi:exosortase E/protease, VPEID-CTERM system [bacterium]|nr:exosortase E/protease, VPEID-CTERM system [bacterium]
MLLISELEFLLVANYDVRTEVRRLVPIPLYHNLLTFVAVAVLTWKITPRRFKQGPKARYSWTYFGIHVVFYLALQVSMSWIYWGVRNWHPLTTAVVLTFLAGVFWITWLLIWQPLGQWWVHLKIQGRWVAQAIGISLMAPAIASYTSSSWHSFAGVTFAATDALLTFLMIDTVASPQQLMLGTPYFVIEIQPGCSGYEGIGLISVLLGVYLYIRRAEVVFPTALWLFVIGAAASWCVNVLRLVALVLIGSKVSPEIAIRGFHSQAGWLSFTLTGMLLIYLAETSRWFRHKSAPHESIAYPALPYLSPLLATLMGTILAEAMRADFNTWYLIKPLLGLMFLIQFRQPIWNRLTRPQMVPSLAVGVLVYLFWILLEQQVASTSPYTALPTMEATVWVLIRCLGGVLVVPIVEELAFRGYLLKRLQQREFETVPDSSAPLLATLLSSLAFGALHTNWLGGVVAGVAYARVATLPGGLSNAILAHSVSNLCIALQVLLLQDWWLW